VHVVGSVSSSDVSAPVKPLSDSDSSPALSSAPSVQQPFHTAGNWNVIGGFKFGAMTSQPLSSAVTVIGLQRAESATVSDVSSSQRLSGTAADVNAKHYSVSASTPLSFITQQKTLASPPPPAAAAADTKSRPVHDAVNSSDAQQLANAVVVSSADGAKSSVPLDASSKSLVVTSSDAVMPPLTSTTSYTAAAAAAAAASPVFSLPLTQQPSALFSSGQAAFANNSSRPLGVPATSASQLKATGCCFVTWIENCVDLFHQYVFLWLVSKYQVLGRMAVAVTSFPFVSSC